MNAHETSDRPKTNQVVKVLHLKIFLSSLTRQDLPSKCDCPFDQSLAFLNILFASHRLEMRPAEEGRPC